MILGGCLLQLVVHSLVTSYMFVVFAAASTENAATAVECGCNSSYNNGIKLVATAAIQQQKMFFAIQLATVGNGLLLS